MLDSHPARHVPVSQPKPMFWMQFAATVGVAVLVGVGVGPLGTVVGVIVGVALGTVVGVIVGVAVGTSTVGAFSSDATLASRSLMVSVSWLMSRVSLPT